MKMVERKKMVGILKNVLGKMEVEEEELKKDVERMVMIY